MLIATSVVYILKAPTDTSRDVLKRAVTETNLEDKNKSITKKNKIEKNKTLIEKLKKINNEVIGLIVVEGTNIMYPILQNGDNEYYLYHDINKNRNKNGSIFLDYECKIENNPSNLIIYGHNTGRGNMFSELMKYRSKNYFDKCKYIKLRTENDEATFEIFAVVKLDLDNKNQFFQFNSYIDKNSEMSPFGYYNEINKRAEHIRKVNVNENSKFITLSTCTNLPGDERLLIVGVKVEDTKI